MQSWKPRHCAVCGSPLVLGAIEGRERAACSACAWVAYENPAAVAAGIVVSARGEVLLVQRALEPERLRWALPAGFQESDETPAEAARREIFEETGLEVEVGELFDLVFVPARLHRALNLAVFVCRPVGGRLAPGPELLAATWFDLDRLPDDIAFDNRARILDPFRTRRG